MGMINPARAKKSGMTIPETRVMIIDMKRLRAINRSNNHWRPWRDPMGRGSGGGGTRGMSTPAVFCGIGGGSGGSKKTGETVCGCCSTVIGKLGV